MIKPKIPSYAKKSSVALKTWTAGSRVDGVWADGISSVSIIRASVTPMNEGDYRRLPQGGLPVDGWKLIGNLVLSRGGDNQKPDEIRVNGVWYHLVHLDDWSHNGQVEALFTEIV